VSGDDGGFFALSRRRRPGDLSTRSAPHFSVGGITIVPGESQEVRLVLDWGDQAIEGHVVDSRGNPLPGAQVSLSWFDRRDGITSSSGRSTVTDAGGLFRFTELGPGPHQLTVAPRPRRRPAKARRRMPDAGTSRCSSRRHEKREKGRNSFSASGATELRPLFSRALGNAASRATDATGSRTPRKTAAPRAARRARARARRRCPQRCLTRRTPDSGEPE